MVQEKSQRVVGYEKGCYEENVGRQGIYPCAWGGGNGETIQRGIRDGLPCPCASDLSGEAHLSWAVCRQCGRRDASLWKRPCLKNGDWILYVPTLAGGTKCEHRALWQQRLRGARVRDNDERC